MLSRLGGALSAVGLRTATRDLSGLSSSSLSSSTTLLLSTYTNRRTMCSGQVPILAPGKMNNAVVATKYAVRGELVKKAEEYKAIMRAKVCHYSLLLTSLLELSF